MAEVESIPEENQSLREELKQAIHAIEILTKRLMNLAVIENRFLLLIEQVKREQYFCMQIRNEVERMVDDFQPCMNYMRLNREDDWIKFFEILEGINGLKWKEKE